MKSRSWVIIRSAPSSRTGSGAATGWRRRRGSWSARRAGGDRGGQEGAGEIQADLVAAGQGGGGDGKVVLGEAESREDRLGPVRLVRAVLPEGKRGGRLREHRLVVEPEVLGEVPDPVPGGTVTAPDRRLPPRAGSGTGWSFRPVASHHPTRSPGATWNEAPRTGSASRRIWRGR